MWLRGDLATQDDSALVNAAINDAMEDIFMSMMRAQLARFFGLDSPVTFSLPAGAERVQLVSVADPTIAPVLGQVAGGILAAHTVLVGYTYVTESGSETQLSPTASLLVNLNNLGQVTAPALVAGAFGWNCYVSSTNNAVLMALQNQQPLPFVVPYQEPITGWQDYPLDQQQPPQAQVATIPTPAGSPPPSENSTADNISWISHMEIRTSDTLLRAWNQADIDSEAMRRGGRTLASASEYQNYAWDLINGNRLEIRPSAGLAFTPRYFYIAKPRRLRYDQAEMPYVSIAGVHEYIVNKSLSRLKLALDEYPASQSWGAEANKTEGKILLALTQENWAKNTRISPLLF